MGMDSMVLKEIEEIEAIEETCLPAGRSTNLFDFFELLDFFVFLVHFIF
jgi:hypothetical protein